MTGKKVLAISLILLGLGLLSSLAWEKVFKGQKTLAINPEGIPGYDYPLLKPGEFQQEVGQHRHFYRDAGMDRELVRTLNRSVFEAICHDDGNQITLGENWIQYVAGWFYSPLRRPQLPFEIEVRGAGICSEACTVLQAHLAEAGISSRFVGLSGHVVLEAEADGQWIYLDPDFGVSAPVSADQMVQAAAEDQPRWQQLRAKLSQLGFSPETIANYRHCLATEEDNVTLPVNQPLSPRLYWFAWFTVRVSPLVALVFVWLGIRIVIPRRVAPRVKQGLANGRSRPSQDGEFAR